MIESFKEYRLKCIEAIKGKIDSGEKRISVVVPVGQGKTGLAIDIAKEHLTSDTQLVFVVNNMIDYAQLLRMAKGAAALFNAKVLKLNEYLLDKTEYDFVFLFDLNYSERNLIQNQIQNDTVYVSFSSLSISSPMVGKKKYQLLAVCVYATKNVLDIRDVRYAGRSEIEYVREDVELVQSQLNLLKDEEIRKNEELVVQNQELQRRIERFETLKHTRNPRGFGPAIPSVIIDESPRLKEELKRNQDEIELHNMTREELLEYIWLQKTIMGMHGISPEKVDLVYGEYLPIKKEAEKLLEDNPEDQDIIIKRAQDQIIDIIEEKLSPTFINVDREHYQAVLIDDLSEYIWNRLDEKSQKFLVTAKVVYDNLQRLNDDHLDYSGVCLLVTKAVEVEISIRFFTNYKKYLTRTYRSVSEWPKAVRVRENGNPTNIELSDDRFTLGDVKYIIGRPRRVNHVFKQYAKSRLYNLNSEREIDNEIEKAYHFVEKIRVDYRNPSAHKDSVSATSAAECMDYVIDVQRMLKEILQPMMF